MGGGVTSPYADPPLAPCFVVSHGDGGRVTFDESEAIALHERLSKWVAELPDLRRRLAATLNPA